ncbi:hypothetical protein ACFL1T_02660 [Chlamydiota bacterium]
MSFLLIYVIFVLFLIISLIICYRKGIYYWIIPYTIFYVRNSRRKEIENPIDIFLCIADHFEPGYGDASIEKQRQRVDRWVFDCPKLAKKHCDIDGYPPKHTWFFPPHYDIDKHLEKLVLLCIQGLGEIELHFHHNRVEPFPDTAETFEKKIQNCINSFSRFNIFSKDSTGKSRFGFIHGDWALDNSRGDKFCGINNELEILSRLGCYADFTFPALYESQPKLLNRIFYAKDNPLKPKSYNTGREVAVGSKDYGDLLIIQGILGIRFLKRINSFFMAIEDSSISNANPPTEKRIDYWINNGISIKGRSHVKFIKLHTHGAWEGSMESLLGRAADNMHSYLESKYNDGKNYRLHYVTAREMYNIIKGLEIGMEENPVDYRDFLVSKPNYTL